MRGGADLGLLKLLGNLRDSLVFCLERAVGRRMCSTERKEKMGSGKQGASTREMKGISKMMMPVDPEMTA